MGALHHVARLARHSRFRSTSAKPKSPMASTANSSAVGEGR